MAEFQEVMKQAKRMCNAYGIECGPCALHEKYGLCPLCAQVDDLIPMDWKLDKNDEIERIVMEWAEKNPEPRYPSWNEWHDTNFPNAHLQLRSCMFESRDYFKCESEVNCEQCMNKPIPADIAEKLGIKPIGGVSDENA